MSNSFGVLIGLASALLIYPGGEPSWHAEDIRGRETPLVWGSSPTIVIFYGPFACRDCYYTLSSALAQLNSDSSGIKIIALMRARGISARRTLITQAQPILPPSTKYSFDVLDTLDDSWPPKNLRSGLWGFFNVSFAPAVLILSPGNPVRYKFLSYVALFDSSRQSTKDLNGTKVTTFEDLSKTKVVALLRASLEEISDQELQR